MYMCVCVSSYTSDLRTSLHVCVSISAIVGVVCIKS